MIHLILELLPIWIVVDSFLLLLLLLAFINGKYERRKKEQEKKKAWNAAAKMKVPGKFSDLYYSHSPR